MLKALQFLLVFFEVSLDAKRALGKRIRDVQVSGRDALHLDGNASHRSLPAIPKKAQNKSGRVDGRHHFEQQNLTSSQPKNFSAMQITGQNYFMGFYTCKTWRVGGKETFWHEENNGYCMDIPIAILVVLLPCGALGLYVSKMCAGIPWPPSKVVLVEGLPKDLTEAEIAEIRAIFARYGYLQAVRRAEKGKNWWWDPQATHGSVLLRYGSVDEATWVVKNLHDNIPEGMQQPVQLSYDDPTDCIWDHQPADLPAPPSQQQMQRPDQYQGSDQYGYDPQQYAQGSQYAPQSQYPPQGAGSASAW